MRPEVPAGAGVGTDLTPSPSTVRSWHRTCSVRGARSSPALRSSEPSCGCARCSPLTPTSRASSMNSSSAVPGHLRRNPSADGAAHTEAPADRIWPQQVNGTESSSEAGWPMLSVAKLQSAGCLLVEDGNHGEYRPRPSEFGAGDTAYIRAADIAQGRVLFETAHRINATALKRIRKGVGRGGDVLFSHKGTVGKLSLVPLDAPPFVCSPQTTFWRTLDERRLDRRFLYYFMSSREFSEQWEARKEQPYAARRPPPRCSRWLPFAFSPWGGR